MKVIHLVMGFQNNRTSPERIEELNHGKAMVNYYIFFIVNKEIDKQTTPKTCTPFYVTAAKELYVSLSRP